MESTLYPRRIVGIDPGTTTGFVCMDLDLKRGENLPNIRVAPEQYGPQPHHLKLYKSLLVLHPEVIVCESFEYRNNSRAGLVLDSVEYIGVVKTYVEAWNVPVIFQTAALGKVQHNKGLVKRTNLERLGLWSPGKVHAMDALGHIMYYLLNDKRYNGTALRLDLLERGWK